MRTINQTLKASDYVLGRWHLWTNDVMHQLDVLRTIPKKKIPVHYTPVAYYSDGLVDHSFWWECEHASTTPGTFEHYDHYRDAVTGVPQLLSYEAIETCESCGAVYYKDTGEWHYDY